MAKNEVFSNLDVPLENKLQFEIKEMQNQFKVLCGSTLKALNTGR